MSPEEEIASLRSRLSEVEAERDTEAKLRVEAFDRAETLSVTCGELRARLSSLEKANEMLTKEQDRLKGELSVAWGDCADGLSCDSCAKCFDRERARADAATARASQAEAQVGALREVLTDISERAGVFQCTTDAKVLSQIETIALDALAQRALPEEGR